MSPKFLRRIIANMGCGGIEVENSFLDHRMGVSQERYLHTDQDCVLGIEAPFTGYSNGTVSAGTTLRLPSQAKHERF